MDRREQAPDQEETLRSAMDDRAASIWTATPGIVESYDPAAMTVTVQVALKMKVRGKDGSETFEPVSVLPDVPVCFPSAGGFSVTFPINPGDECLVIFGMRCMDSWWQMGGVQQPLDARMHDPSDGFAVFGPRSQPRVLKPAPGGENFAIRADDGSASLELTPGGKLLVKAPGGVEVTTPLVEITGNVKVGGSITAAGDVKGGPISLGGHAHTGVRSGAENTGTPVR